MPSMMRVFSTILLSLVLAGCNALNPLRKNEISCQTMKADLPWGALSGLSSDTRRENRLYAVHDHNLSPPEILVMELERTQAHIIDSIPLIKAGQAAEYDLEGIARRQEDGFWLASEGKPGRKRPNLILRANAQGQVQEEIPLPSGLSRNAVKAGLEGIAAWGSGTKERVAVVFQRSWKDDPRGQVKIGQYWPATGQWEFYRYPLSARKGLGLSSISFLNDGSALVLERDNRPFLKARTKQLYRIFLPTTPGQTEGHYPLLNKQPFLDILSLYPMVCGNNGKLEGMTTTPDGKIYLVADDDGDGSARLLHMKIPLTRILHQNAQNVGFLP